MVIAFSRSKNGRRWPDEGFLRSTGESSNLLRHGLLYHRDAALAVGGSAVEGAVAF
jgi:hypothetical protein